MILTASLFAVLALAAHITVPRRRLIAAAAALLALAHALPMSAPCTLSAAVLVALERVPVPSAVPLLAAATAGLAALAFPGAVPVLSLAIGVAVLIKTVAIFHGTSSLWPGLLAEQSASVALAIALLPLMLPIAPKLLDPRLAALVGTSAATLAGTLGVLAVWALEHRRAALFSKRLGLAYTRHSRRTTPALALFAGPLSPLSTLPPLSTDDPQAPLTDALERIVHELRQPVGAALNGLAAAALPSTDAATSAEMLSLARSELQGAVNQLGVLAQFCGVNAGDPFPLPPNDAVDVALGGHLDGIECMHGASIGTLAVDPAQFGQALSALIANARDADPGGPVRVETSRDDAAARFVVRVIDLGPEPATESLHSATIPFFTTRAGRMGLGASVAARFASVMGGTFCLRREGAQTVAELRLPSPL